MINVGNDWQGLMDEEQGKDYYLALRNRLKEAYRKGEVYPPMDEIFNAFRLTPFSSVKVVIVGQDPYHEPGQAMGLSFSVREGCEEPPSLRNIHQEIVEEGVEQGPWSSDLSRWARQGVLLLNSTLTVEAHRAASHSQLGWERLTDRCIEALGPAGHIASPPHPRVGPSKSAVGLQGLLRQRTFQGMQRLPQEHGPGAHRLVAFRPCLR